VPARTPANIVERLNAEMRKAVAQPAVQHQFSAQGLEPGASSPRAFGEYLRTEVEKWGRVVKASGAVPE
jgi:tripartite-type tricarboxylate transporter receptor subunit TctC